MALSTLQEVAPAKPKRPFVLTTQASVVFGLLAAASVAVLVRSPSVSGMWPTCPIHAVTGGFCPGCGSSRALESLLHGNLLDAFWFNPLFIPALVWIVWWGVTSRKPASGPPKSNRAIAIFLVVVVVLTVARNIPALGLAPGIA